MCQNEKKNRRKKNKYKHDKYVYGVVNVAAKRFHWIIFNQKPNNACTYITQSSFACIDTHNQKRNTEKRLKRTGSSLSFKYTKRHNFMANDLLIGVAVSAAAAAAA